MLKNNIIKHKFKFEIFNSTEENFFLRISSDNQGTTFNIIYKNIYLEENILYKIENNSELRKLKLKQINGSI